MGSHSNNSLKCNFVVSPKESNECVPNPLTIFEITFTLNFISFINECKFYIPSTLFLIQRLKQCDTGIEMEKQTNRTETYIHGEFISNKNVLQQRKR